MIYGNKNDLDVIFRSYGFQVLTVIVIGASTLGLAVSGLLYGVVFVKFRIKIPGKHVLSKAIVFFAVMWLVFDFGYDLGSILAKYGALPRLGLFDIVLALASLGIYLLWGITFSFLFNRWSDHETTVELVP